jgi:hypothetical protein
MFPPTDLECVGASSFPALEGFDEVENDFVPFSFAPVSSDSSVELLSLTRCELGDNFFFKIYLKHLLFGPFS